MSTESRNPWRTINPRAKAASTSNSTALQSSVCTMKRMSVPKFLPHVFVLTVLFAWPVAESATSPAAVRADLTHVDSGRGFSKRELLHRMAARSKARVASLSSSARPSASAQAVTPAPVAGGSGEYLVHFGIGTPRPQRPQRVALTLDTSSDLIWTQCACETCFNQTMPVLDPAASGTIRGVTCSDPLCRRPYLRLSWCAAKDNFCFYVHDYADRSITAGKIFKDTFTFRAPHGGAIAAVPNVRFGCGMHNTGVFQSNETGIAGFGRGPLSLPSQLKVSRFSYCFTPFLDSKTSPVFLGAPDNLEAHAMGPVQSTPFARGPEGSSSYYISLQGITVGKTRLAFDASAFMLNGDGPGAGGTIIDSATGITIFPEAVYRSIREAFVTQVPLPADDSSGMLCFGIPPKKKAPEVPKLILHLEGADWELPPDNYVLDFEVDGYGGALCVMIDSAGESDVTTIGNYELPAAEHAYRLRPGEQ